MRPSRRLEPHSAGFTRVRDAILALPDDKDRARLAGLFGSMTTRPHRKLGALRAILRAIAELDDDDLEKLAKWFSTWVNNWGQTPAAAGYALTPSERIAPPAPPKDQSRHARRPDVIGGACRGRAVSMSLSASKTFSKRS
jgi:hypothetical protein